MEAPGALEVARFPTVVTSVIVPGVNVPVCVVSRCVFTSVAKCVLQRMHSAGERRCVRGTTSESEKACVDEAPRVPETPCMEETPCVSGVVASVPECVLPSTPCMDEAPRVSGAACVRETACVCERPCANETPRVSAPACVSEMARVSERPSMRETACVRSLYVREMTVGMREHAAASPGVSLMECSLSFVTRRCAWVEWRRRRHQTMDKGRVAAVVAMGTVRGLHSSERAVRAVQRTRPPRARLRE